MSAQEGVSDQRGCLPREVSAQEGVCDHVTCDACWDTPPPPPHLTIENPNKITLTEFYKVCFRLLFEFVSFYKFFHY